MKKLKKLLITGLACGTMITGLAGCSAKDKNGENTVKTDMVEVEVYHGDYSALLGDEINNQAYNIGFAILDDEVKAIGDTFPNTKFTTYSGEVIDTPEGPYVLDVLGSWCTYCQHLTQETLQDLLDKGYKVYQYFAYGTKEDVDSFYETIGMGIPEGVVILLDNTDMNSWLDGYGYMSVPMTFPVDENGKITLPHVGYMNSQGYQDYLTFALNNSIAETKVGNETLRDYIQKQVAIKQYIDSLETIEVPADILK